MKLEFASIEEVKEFVAQLKGTRRGGKDDPADPAPAPQAPAPMMPPGGAPAAGFQAPGPFGAPAAAFGGGVSPEVTALLQRVTSKMDWALQNGQSADSMLGWFRGQLGPEAAAATMDQIKTVFLPRLTVPALDNMAKLMGA